MGRTDRAFRALARSEPDVVLALLRTVLPGFPPGAVVGAESVEDSKLDLPPPIEADLIARQGTSGILHVEGQGYREADFETRVFQYHLALALRHPHRRIQTVALWLERPPRSQRDLRLIERAGVSVEITTVVLPDVPASSLLAQPDLACFVPGADGEGRSDQELCRLAVAALLEGEKRRGPQEGVLRGRLLFAVAIAAAAGRYDAMIRAMQEANLDPPIIEDLVRYGMDVGRSEGLETGRREGLELAREALRQSVQELLAVRGLSLSDEDRARLEAEVDLERLRQWLRRAAVADSVERVFGG